MEREIERQREKQEEKQAEKQEEKQAAVYIRVPAAEIPVAKTVDVLVLGSGPAGVSAAITAGREGAKTLLVESCGNVGGIATEGLMSHWTGNTEGGIYEEILERSGQGAKAVNDERNQFNGGERQIINPEHLKTVLLDMLVESGVDLMLYTMASEPIMDGDTIKGVIVQNKNGREAILAKIVVDATGDGDIAARAGAPYVIGRESDGKMQPATLMFKVAGVDVERGVFPGGFEDHAMIPASEIPLLRESGKVLESGGEVLEGSGEDSKEPLYDIQKLGEQALPKPAGHVLLYKTTLPDVVTCNMTNCIGIDGTKAEDLTRATYLCRKQMEIIEGFLRDYVPGFEHCYIISSGSLIGIRETRHFKGEQTITEQDILEARVFEDWVVARAQFNFDVHNLTGNGLDETGSQKHFRQEKGYTIPYGCFVPLKVENLYLAGRNISGTHMAHSNYRVMPICANMGQAVGVAAAMCVKDRATPRTLDAKKVQRRMMELGVEP